MSGKNNLFIGHAIIINRDFKGYSYSDGSLDGCYMEGAYIACREFSILEMKDCGTYIYNGNECQVINLEDLNLSENDQLFNCSKCCNHIEPWALNCSRTADIPNEIVGFVGVLPLLDYTNMDDQEIAIKSILKYNETVKGQYVFVTDNGIEQVMAELNGEEIRNHKVRKRDMEKPKSE